MGSLARKVKLSEGAKPGIPNLEIYKIDTESAQMTILVSIEELLSRKALKQFALYSFLLIANMMTNFHWSCKNR